MSLQMPPFVVSVIPERDRVDVLAAGELDLSTTGALRAQLVELFDVGWQHVTADLREVEFMDTSGVHVLLDAQRRAEAAGGQLTVVVEPGPVRLVLDLTGMGERLSLAVATEDRQG
jgi:anti-anti-sigma factor